MRRQAKRKPPKRRQGEQRKGERTPRTRVTCQMMRVMCVPPSWKTTLGLPSQTLLRGSSPGNSHSRALYGAPCDFQRSARLHPAQRAAGYGSLNPARDFSPGNSHSRAVNSAPCDFRCSVCLHPPLAAADSDPLDPSPLRAASSSLSDNGKII